MFMIEACPMESWTCIQCAGSHKTSTLRDQVCTTLETFLFKLCMERNSVDTEQESSHGSVTKQLYE